MGERVKLNQPTPPFPSRSGQRGVDQPAAAVQVPHGRADHLPGVLVRDPHDRLLVDTTLAARAENAMAQLDSLLADVKRNPRRYVRLSIF